MADDAKRPDMSAGAIQLRHAQADLDAAKNNRHWLSGTVPHAQLVAECEALLKEQEEAATAPESHNPEERSNA